MSATQSSLSMILDAQRAARAQRLRREGRVKLFFTALVALAAAMVSLSANAQIEDVISGASPPPPTTPGIVRTQPVYIPVDGSSDASQCNSGLPDEPDCVRACVIHQPDTLAEQPPSPVIVEWTSYVVEDENAQPAGGCPPQYKNLAEWTVSEGYIFVAANPRGVRSSGAPGDTSENWGTRDGREGAAMLQWINDQSWSDGKIGVVGCSNSAQHLLQLAVQQPQVVDALAPSCAALDTYRGAFYPGGIRNWTIWTFFARAPTDVTQAEIDAGLRNGDFGWVNRILSGTETGSDVYMTTEDTPRQNLPPGDPQPLWEELSTRNTIDNINVPVYWNATWHDFFRGGPEWAMNHMKQGDRIMFYPGWHGAAGAVRGQYQADIRNKLFFDHHLRGGPDPFAGEKPVLFWMMDGGWINGIAANALYDRFYEADQWPPVEVAYQKWYLREGRTGANPTSLNDGLLSQTPPSPPALGETGSDSYPYPSPGTGGANDPLGGVGQWQDWPAAVEDLGGAVVYVSDPMPEPMYLAGPITVHLFASSTATDTDWVVKILSQAPDGSFRHISNGWLKATHRALDAGKTITDGSGEIIRPYHPHTNPEALTPGVVQEYVIEVWQTAAEIPAGHRLKLWVSSQEAPWFIQEIPPSTNTVMRTPDEASYIYVPVLPASALKTPGTADNFPGAEYYTESHEINRMLTFGNPLSANVELPAGTTSLPMTINYSPYMDPATFQARLNGSDAIAAQFNAQPGTTEVVNLPLNPGVNKLDLRAIVGDPLGNTGGARQVKDIDKFTITVGP